MPATATMTRPLFEIAQEIVRDWGIGKIYFGAEPYLRAMLALNEVADQYGTETGADIERRFLINAHSWRGETAQRVKAELKAML